MIPNSLGQGHIGRMPHFVPAVIFITKGWTMLKTFQKLKIKNKLKKLFHAT
jgi:hypothetical protein